MGVGTTFENGTEKFVVEAPAGRVGDPAEIEVLDRKLVVAEADLASDGRKIRTAKGVPKRCGVLDLAFGIGCRLVEEQDRILGHGGEDRGIAAVFLPERRDEPFVRRIVQADLPGHSDSLP